MGSIKDLIDGLNIYEQEREDIHLIPEDIDDNICNWV